MKTETEFNSIYGEVFSELREQEGLSLSDFKEVGLSKTTLSDFELGKSFLRYDKFMAALELIRVEVGEYALMVREYEPDYFEKAMKVLIHANWAGKKKSKKFMMKVVNILSKNSSRWPLQISCMKGLTDEKNTCSEIISLE